MELGALVGASTVVAATRSRTAKVAELARVLKLAAAAGEREVMLATAFLSGRVPHGRLGVGYRTLSSLPPPAGVATLTLADVDAAFTALAAQRFFDDQVGRSRYRRARVVRTSTLDSPRTFWQGEAA